MVVGGGINQPDEDLDNQIVLVIETSAIAQRKGDGDWGVAANLLSFREQSASSCRLLLARALQILAASAGGRRCRLGKRSASRCRPLMIRSIPGTSSIGRDVHADAM
jgi:hypothetical protein